MPPSLGLDDSGSGSMNHSWSDALKDAVDAAAAHCHTANHLIAVGSYSAAASELKSAMALQQAGLGGAQLNVGRSCWSLGDALAASGNIKAVEYHLMALDIYQKVLGMSDVQLAPLYDRVALDYQSTGQYASALQYYNEGLSTRIQGLGPEHPEVGSSHRKVGGLHSKMSDHRSAAAAYLKALHVSETLLPRDTPRPQIAADCVRLAEAYKAMEAYRSALDMYRRAINLWEEDEGSDGPHVCDMRDALSSVFSFLTQYDSALAICTGTVALRRAKADPGLHHSLRVLGDIHKHKGEYDQALEMYQRALLTSKEKRGGTSGTAQQPPSPSSSQEASLYGEGLEKAAQQVLDTAEFDTSVAAFFKDVAGLLVAKKDYSGALAKYQSALFQLTNAVGDYADERAVCLQRMVAVCTLMQDYTEARKQYEALLWERALSLPEGHTALAECRCDMAKMDQLLGKHEEALQVYEAELGTFKMAFGDEHLRVGDCLLDMAQAYEDLGHCERAIGFYEKAIAILEKYLSSDDPVLSACHGTISRLHRQLISGQEPQLQDAGIVHAMMEFMLEKGVPPAEAHRKARLLVADLDAVPDISLQPVFTKPTLPSEPKTLATPPSTSPISLPEPPPAVVDEPVAPLTPPTETLETTPPPDSPLQSPKEPIESPKEPIESPKEPIDSPKELIQSPKLSPQTPRTGARATHAKLHGSVVFKTDAAVMESGKTSRKSGVKVPAGHKRSGRTQTSSPSSKPTRSSSKSPPAAATSAPKTPSRSPEKTPRKRSQKASPVGRPSTARAHSD